MIKAKSQWCTYLKRRINIALVTQDFYPKIGGISRYLLNVYKKYFQETNFIVIIPEDLGDSKSYESFPFKVIRTKFNIFGTEKEQLVVRKNILKFLIEENIDVVLFGYIRAHPEVGYLSAKLFDKHYGFFTHAKEVIFNLSEITNVNGSQCGYTIQEVEKFKYLLRNADFIFTVSSFTKSLLENINIPSNKITIVPPVIDTKKSPNMSREELGLPNDRSIILSVGRLIPRKGHINLVKSISRLVKKNYNPLLIIIGDGPEKEKITFEIKKNNLKENVLLLDQVCDDLKLEYYNICDFFVMLNDYLKPNEVEGFGIVFLEANLFRKPVIGGRNGGVADAIIHSVTGFLVDPRNPDEIDDRIELLINDIDLRNELGKNGRERVIENFNINFNDSLIKKIGGLVD